MLNEQGLEIKWLSSGSMICKTRSQQSQRLKVSDRGETQDKKAQTETKTEASHLSPALDPIDPVTLVNQPLPVSAGSPQLIPILVVAILLEGPTRP